MKDARCIGVGLAGESISGALYPGSGPEKGVFMTARPAGRAESDESAGITGLANVAHYGAAVEK